MSQHKMKEFEPCAPAQRLKEMPDQVLCGTEDPHVKPVQRLVSVSVLLPR